MGNKTRGRKYYGIWGKKMQDGSEIWHTEPIFKINNLLEKIKFILTVVKPILFYHLVRQKQTRILDLGCGTGGTTIDLSKVFKCQVWGIDVHGNQINVAKEQNRKYKTDCKFLVYKEGRLPFKSGYFSGVYCSDVFGHVNNLEQFIKEIFRVLAPGGRAAIFSETRVARGALIQHYLYKKGVDTDPYKKFHISLYSKEELLKMVAEARFIILSSYSPYPLRFLTHPELFYASLQKSRKFPALRNINKVIFIIKRTLAPVSSALIQIYCLIEILTVGRLIATQGLILLLEKPQKVRTSSYR